MSSQFELWMIGNYGTPGEYSYKTIYWVTLSVVALIIAGFCVIGYLKCVSDRAKRWICIGIGSFCLIFEVAWRLINYFYLKNEAKWLWPMYPCNVAGIIVPLFAVLNFRIGKGTFYLFGFFGGCLTFAMPDGIFTRDRITYPILKSILQHIGILLIPCFEYAANIFKPSIIDYPLMIIGCLLHILNAEVIDPLFGFEGDFMFLNKMELNVPGIPNWVFTVVLALILFAFLNYISDYKTSNEQLRTAYAWIKRKCGKGENDNDDNNKDSMSESSYSLSLDV